MYFFINLLFIFIFLIISNLFFSSQKKFTYIKIIKIYLITFIIFILLSLKFNFLNFNQSFNYLCLVMNFMFFISYILIIGIRFINSPSYDIINFIKNNQSKKKDLLEYLNKKNFILERIKILENEKLIELKNDIMFLSKNGKIFCKIFLYIKIFFRLKSEG